MRIKRRKPGQQPVILPPKEEPLPLGSMFEHNIEDVTYRVEVAKGDRCKGCVAMEGLKIECHKLWAKAGSCFANQRPDKTEVIFKNRRSHFQREEETGEDEA